MNPSLVFPTLSLLLACRGGDDRPPPTDPPLAATLSPEARLSRISTALRGRRASIDELDRVHADPALVETYVDAWLAGPELGVVVRDLHDATLHLRHDTALLPANGYLADMEMSDIRESLFEEPLKIVEEIVTTDQPYRDILAVDWTMADAVVAGFWVGLEAYDPAVGGWQRLPWADGRPAAGILSASALWMVYRSAGSNFNRGRANFLARSLLCDDFLDFDIAVDPSLDLSDPDVVSSAVQTEPACIACHDTLDPLASFLPFREYFVIQRAELPVWMYLPTWDSGEGWTGGTGVAPNYYGQGGGDLADLGQWIADDPRFAECTARRFSSFFTQRAIDAIPAEEAATLTGALLASDWSAKALIRAVVLSDAFAAGPGADGVWLRSSPETLSRVVADWTGFTWETEDPEPCCGAPMGSAPLGRLTLTTDAWQGWQTLLGGTDGDFATTPSPTINATTALAVAELAGRAAGAVVDEDFALPATARRLLTSVEANTADEAAIRAQLATLELRMFATRLDPADPGLDPAWALWSASFAEDADPVRAWKLTLTALLQDPRVVYY